MIVFDVDGTLIDDEAADWSSFEAAFLEVAGFGLDAEFFAGLEEITAKAIVHVALADLAPAERVAKETAVRTACLRHMRAAHARRPGCFAPVPGAADLLRELQAAGVPVAIATGDWRETITFKLEVAGLDVTGLPMMTSSEHYSRADIIRAAVTLAGRSLDEAAYVGDGVWDLRACHKLGIPFIGVGRRREKLRAAGAGQVLPDLTPAAFHVARANLR